MNYVGFFAVLLPLEMCLVVTAVYFTRRRTRPTETHSWLRLLGLVFLLTLVVNVITLLPVVGIAAAVVWLVGMKRLSGLDVLGTVLFSTTLGVLCFAAMMILARYFQVPLAGQRAGG